LSSSTLAPSGGNRRARWPVLALLFGVALALRLVFLLETRGASWYYLTRYTVDAWYFRTMAQYLAAHGFNWPEVFFMPPLYPYLLAAYTFIFGSGLGFLQFLQLVLGSITAVLVFRLAERTFDRTVAIAAFAGYLLYGNTLFLDAAYLPNALTTFLQMTAVYVLVLAADKAPTLRSSHLLSIYHLVVGTILGLLMLIRAEFLLTIPLIILFWLLLRLRRKTGTVPVFRARSLGGLALGCAIVVAPVFLHNLLRGDPTLISYNGGLNFYLGNNPKADGTWQPAYPLVQTGSVTIETLKRNSLTRPDGTLMKPSASSGYWLDQALHFIRTNPGRFLQLTARRLGLLVNNYEVPNNYYFDLARQRSWTLKLAFLPFGLILALGVAGLLMHTDSRKSPTHDPGRTTLLVIALLFLIIHLTSGTLILTVSRLRAPLVPLLAGFAAYCAVSFVKPRSAPARRRVMPGLVALVIIAASFLPLTNRKTYAVEGHIQAGNIYLEVKQARSAQAEYQQALRLEPGNLIATHGLFNTSTQLKNKLDAEHYSDELYRLSRSPSDSIYAYLSTAKLSTMTGNFTQARDYYLRALELDPANADTRYLLALVYYTLKDIPAARAQLEQTLVLDPGNSDARKFYSQLPQ
jgi:4-amino-4-deoxy-L-arabinose transferase-like glycosyltransferase